MMLLQWHCSPLLLSARVSLLLKSFCLSTVPKQTIFTSMTPPDRPISEFLKHLTEDSKAAVIDAFDTSTMTAPELVASLIKNGGYVICGVLNPD